MTTRTHITLTDTDDLALRSLRAPGESLSGAVARLVREHRATWSGRSVLVPLPPGPARVAHTILARLGELVPRVAGLVPKLLADLGRLDPPQDEDAAGAGLRIQGSLLVVAEAIATALQTAERIHAHPPPPEESDHLHQVVVAFRSLLGAITQDRGREHLDNHPQGTLLQAILQGRATTATEDEAARLRARVAELEHLLARVAQLEAERSWLPVSEGYPTTADEVLLFLDGRRDRGHWDGLKGRWWLQEEQTWREHDETEGPVPTHWMPLPQDPPTDGGA